MEREAKRALAISAITGAAVVLFYVWLAFWGDSPQGKGMFDEAETDGWPSFRAPHPDDPLEPLPETVPVKKA